MWSINVNLAEVPKADNFVVDVVVVVAVVVNVVGVALFVITDHIIFSCGQ